MSSLVRFENKNILLYILCKKLYNTGVVVVNSEVVGISASIRKKVCLLITTT
jgi:hypothetical protein